MVWTLLLSLLLRCITVDANVEKVIFSAPPLLTTPQDASIDNLLLTSLNPQHLNTRTFLNASFPSTEEPKGTQSWVLLEGLNPGQRYEVRVCWLATQPTSFWLTTYPLKEVFETPDLISSLSSYAYGRHAQLSREDIQGLSLQRHRSRDDTAKSSLLFLQIHAAADYFSLNQALMDDVPPIHVDIILDPYLLNIFPQSLLPTAAYIGVLAIVGWVLSGWIFRRMRLYINSGDVQEKKTR